MNIWKKTIVFVLLFFTCSFYIYGLYYARKINSQGMISTSISDVSSTKEWQNLLYKYLSIRYKLINDILDGRYTNSKKYHSTIKAFEVSPLLDGDIKTLEYMYNHPDKFSSRVRNIKVEYSNIRKLTKNEVSMVSKICYDENKNKRRYDYEVTFTNVDGKWKLSRFSYLN